MTTLAEAFAEGVRWRERQNNNGIVRNEYITVHNPYSDDERTVRVPVSLIERAVQRLIHNTADAWNVVDELRAYLSQPTPTAELIACPHWEPGEITMRKGCTACAAT